MLSLTRCFHLCFVALVCVLSTPSVRAETTRYVELEGFAHLLDGEFDGVTLAEDGTLSLGPATLEKPLPSDAALGASVLWRNRLIAARLSHPGGIVGVDDKGNLLQLMGAQPGVVTKLFAEPERLIIAGGPNATLQQIDAKGRVQKLQAPDAKFVWDLVRGPDAALYAVSGEPGALWRQKRDGTWTCVWKSKEAHLKVLATAPAQRALIIGGGERGIVYRASTTGAVQALFDTQNREVTALAVVGSRIVVSAVTGAQAAVLDEPQAQKVEVKSQLFALEHDGAAEGLAASNDEVIFDVLPYGPNEVLVATGATARTGGVSRGRLYRIDLRRRQVTLQYQSPSRRLVRLLAGERGHVLALSQQGPRVIELIGDVRRRGTYTSAAADLGVTAQLGLAATLGAFPANSDAQLEVRSGQTSEPDETWSPWSTPIAHHQPRAPDVARGRFVQLRLTLSGAGTSKPLVYRQRLAYLRQNMAPSVREVGVMERGIAVSALPPSFGGDDGPVRIAPLFEKAEEAVVQEAVARRGPPRVRQSHEPGALTVRWLADDINGDELEYTLWMRETREPRWTLVKEQLSDPFYTFGNGQLADGHYIFHVEASDIRSNPLELAKKDGRDSRVVLVDNKPPVIGQLRARTDKHRATLTATIHDDTGPLAELNYSLDGAPLRPVLPEDGVLDGPDETMRLTLEQLAAGVHVFVLHAKDAAGNESSAAESFVVGGRLPAPADGN